VTVELPIDAITVGDRHRHDLGAIASLAESIDTLGLIHPVVVTPDHRLVAGERRLAALRSLGWDMVPVTVIHSLDEAGLVLAEQHENTCRKDFTLTEAAAMRAAVTEVLAPLAAERMKAGVSQPSGKLPEGKPRPQTRDVAASGTGYSGRTLDKVDRTRELADDTTVPEPVRETAREALAEMDRTNNADAAYKKAAEAQQLHGAITDFPDLTHYADTGRQDDAIRLAAALRAYTEPELSVRLDALRRTIAADKAGKLTPKNDEGPDYRALADKMFYAANNASSVITNSGGTDTITTAIAHADQLTIANWRSQFQALAATCHELAQACTPKLKVMK